MRISKSDKIRSVISTARGLRTNKSFAQDCGLTPPYLSRLMSGKIKPTDATLKKIAAHADNGVSLEDLRSAFGISAASGPTAIPHSLSYEKSDDWTYVIGLAAAICSGETFEDVYVYLQRVTDEIKILEDGWNYEIDSEIIRSAFVRDGIRGYIEADFTFRVPKEITRVKTVLSFIWGGGRNLGMKISVDMATLYKYFPAAVNPVVFDDPENAPDMQACYAETQTLLPDGDETLADKVTRWKTEKPVSVPNVQRGYGFYLDDVSQETLTQWCENNRRYWPDGLEKAEDYDDVSSDEKASTPGLVARILREKTGFSFMYVNPAEIEGEKIQEKPVIMVAAEDCESFSAKYDRGTVLRACRNAASELGIPFYGEVWYQWYQDLLPVPEYSTDFPDQTSVNEVKTDFTESVE